MDEIKELKHRIFKADMAEQRVMLLEDKKPEKTKSGIYIPKNVEDERPKICTVIEAGKGSADLPMVYNIGEKVLLSKYSGVTVELNLDGIGLEEFIVTNQMDIMAKLTEINKEEKK